MWLLENLKAFVVHIIFLLDNTVIKTRVYIVVLRVGTCRGSGKCSPRMPWLQLFQLTWLGHLVLQGCFEGSYLQAATTSLPSLTLATHEVLKKITPPPSLMVANFCLAS